jgi:amino acid permease
MSVIFFGYLYILTTAGYRFLNTDLRFIWPFLRPFSGGRFLQFLLYFPFFLLFFLCYNTLNEILGENKEDRLRKLSKCCNTLDEVFRVYRIMSWL